MKSPESLRPGEPVRLLYVAMADDYGLRERGPGYEAFNMEPAIRGLGWEVRQFDYARVLQERGYWEVQAGLEACVADWRPHVLFCVLYQEQIDRDVMSRITATTGTVTVGWFSDDHWRFEDYSRHWAPAFDWVVTTDLSAPEKYRALGKEGVILSQWAANERIYRPMGEGLKHEVTFVGQRYGRREKLVSLVRDSGFKVEAWGPGWPAGRLSQQEMIRVFASSKVNLNFGAASAPGRPEASVSANQIKGRVFEVPACGGLLLTDYAPGLERYYRPGEEICVFSDPGDLLAQVRALLTDEPHREGIARAGYERTCRDHTWGRRVRDIFRAVGLPVRPEQPVVIP